MSEKKMKAKRAMERKELPKRGQRTETNKKHMDEKEDKALIKKMVKKESRK